MTAETLSAADDVGHHGTLREPQLFLAFRADRPQTEPVRLRLAGISEVAIGRGEALGLEACADRLVVRTDDPWMSSCHAVVRRTPDGWELSDARSKNGSLVNGARIERAALRDGDVIELGQTFWILRTGVFAGREPVQTLGRILEPVARNPTILPPLGAELDRLATVARSSVAIMVGGESGTGKERIARAVHELSGRAGAFIGVNCGALPDTLAASELFGCRKGAFSGALEDRPGLVRAADGGTLFLDEIGDLADELQPMLLRVLQEHEVLPLGATRAVPVSFRLVSATHRDLPALVAAGRFRNDLMRRLAGFELRLPPLRERREDLGLAIAAMLRRHEQPDTALHPRAARILFAHDWPGNARELDTVVATALTLARPGPIRSEHLAIPVAAAGDAPPPCDDDPREALTRLLREHHGNIAAVSRAMGKARMQVHRWLKRYGLDASAFRAG